MAEVATFSSDLDARLTAARVKTFDRGEKASLKQNGHEEGKSISLKTEITFDADDALLHAEERLARLSNELFGSKPGA